jgi:hypothetical protein
MKTGVMVDMASVITALSSEQAMHLFGDEDAEKLSALILKEEGLPHTPEEVDGLWDMVYSMSGIPEEEDEDLGGGEFIESNEY